jgi:hypothetical protein
VLEHARGDTWDHSRITTAEEQDADDPTAVFFNA